ncbi:MAG: 3-phosphoshikimate 1-carboxyvinyltransferase [Anaerolineae bacterium]
MDLYIRRGYALRGDASVPGDKSIAHRALMLAALAEGQSCLRGIDALDDVARTLAALQACGIEIDWSDARTLRVRGRGLRGLRTPPAPIHCGLSGTTMRLLAGLLAGQPLEATLDGDEGLRRRPMGRVVEPLRRMGAQIHCYCENHPSPSPLPSRGEGAGAGQRALQGEMAPLHIRGGGLHGIDYTLPVASAQVKSALLLAGLNAEGETVVREDAPSRDHTERFLRWLGQPITVSDGCVRLSGAWPWPGFDYCLPGDLSGAAFLLAAAALVEGSDVQVPGVGLNPSRAGVLAALCGMGARLEAEPWPDEPGGEPVGNLRMRAGPLRSIEVGGASIPNLIDELPILAVLATQAEGQTVVRDAAELRVKESDRIASLSAGLRALGARFEATADGFVVEGPTPLRGARVQSAGDHRIAMALAVAGLVAEGETAIAGAECVTKSFPGFGDCLRRLGADVRW